MLHAHAHLVHTVVRTQRGEGEREGGRERERERERQAAAAAEVGARQVYGERAWMSLDAAAIAGLKVAELKAELEQRGLPTGGKKADLAARLTQTRQTRQYSQASFTLASRSLLTLYA